MRLTQYFLPILRETPAEAQIVSHRLMLRAGMIRQAARRDLLLAAARLQGAAPASSRSSTRSSSAPATSRS